jgi:hypothetical protein
MLCLTFLIAPDWPSEIVGPYSFWIGWSQRTWASHLGVANQIRLVSALAVAVVSFLVWSSFRWLQVRFLKIWFAYAALLLGALTFCLSFLVAPSWPIETAKLWAHLVEWNKKTQMPYLHLNVRNEIRFAAVLAAVIVRFPLSSSFGWFHQKFDNSANVLERRTPADIQLVSDDVFLTVLLPNSWEVLSLTELILHSIRRQLEAGLITLAQARRKFRSQAIPTAVLRQVRRWFH